MAKKTTPKIPALPYGEGSMYLTKDDTVEYKKVIKRGDGRKVRKTVHGSTARECIAKMKIVEMEERRAYFPKSKTPLIDEMYCWLEAVKKPQLREQAYNRLEGTVRNRIGTSRFRKFTYQSITEMELREFLNGLNNGELSFSEIKKTYDCLNAFYRYVSRRDGFPNPMELIQCVNEERVSKPKKRIAYYDENDIKFFVQESKVLWKSSGKLRYRYGPIIAANIFLGLRIGELLALKWEDVDLGDKCIRITKTQIERRKDPKTGEEGGFVVQPYTKTKNGYRKVPINDKAKELIEYYKTFAEYTEDEDYVLSTRNKKMTTTKNIQDSIRSIVSSHNKVAQEDCRIKVLASNTHILRHTCASLYFKNGVDPLIISKILGNSEEVLKQTYIHIWPDALDDAASKIIGDMNLI